MFETPKWISKHIFPYKRVDDIPRSLLASVNAQLDIQQSETPAVSILVAAWNEEENLLNCISSLAALENRRPYEIIVINNNSTDGTQRLLDRLHVKHFFQPIQGCGPARQLGQEKAAGKYILLADADCIYPPCWMDDLVDKLEEDRVVCVYGRYSFLPEKGFPRWKLFLLERMKDVIAEIRHLKRPYLNAYGISMGYVRELGLKVGYVMRKVWGDDGRLCFDLMQFGKVKQVKSNRARVWTKPRTLKRDGKFSDALWTRLTREFSRLSTMFVSPQEHDTKTSEN